MYLNRYISCPLNIWLRIPILQFLCLLNMRSTVRELKQTEYNTCASLVGTSEPNAFTLRHSTDWNIFRFISAALNISCAISFSLTISFNVWNNLSTIRQMTTKHMPRLKSRPAFCATRTPFRSEPQRSTCRKVWTQSSCFGNAALITRFIGENISVLIRANSFSGLHLRPAVIVATAPFSLNPFNAITWHFITFFSRIRSIRTIAIWIIDCQPVHSTADFSSMCSDPTVSIALKKWEN